MKALAMAEPTFQRAIVDLAKMLGLLVHHCRPAAGRDGKWVTPIQGHQGFCDLVIAGPGGVLFRELKNDITQPTPQQNRWIDMLRSAGADVAIWRPAQLRDGTIETALKALTRPRGVA